MIVKRGLIAGIAALVVGFGLNWLIEAVFPSIAQEYQNPAIFRPWTDPLMIVYFAHPFILGIVLAYLWNILEKQLSGDSINKAFQFAKLYFVIATIPGMFISYTSFQVSLFMILAWAVSGFLQVFAAGLVFARVK